MVVLGMGLFAPRAQAQDPDVRSLTPVVMLVLDTSGSMEGMPGCSCPGNPDSNLCDDCYPDCAAGEKNRWALAVEALSGSFNSFQCTQVPRTDPAFTYDRGYVAPHHALPPPVQACALNSDCTTGVLGLLGLGTCDLLGGICQNGSAQNSDGVLDAYVNDVRFGLISFDTIGTYAGASQLIPEYEFLNSRSEAVEGAFSYGGPHDFTYPNCINTYRMDTGVRSDVATEGRLISAGTDTANWQAINAQIQGELRTIRPFGGTPIAASLSDLDYYFRNHPDMTTDAFSACRGRYGVLITDGKPDLDFRQFGCDQPGFQCPYRLPEDEAGILRCGPSDPTCAGGGGSGTLEKLFVVGLDVTDPAARTQLNLIAQRGGNLPDMSGDYALFVSDAASITTAMAGILDAAQTYPISRTTPVVARSRNGRSYRITAAFERPGQGLPWNGLLERQELGCGTDPDVALDDLGRFHEVLNDNSNRVLFTALPTDNSFTTNGPMSVSPGGTACGSGGCPNVCFASSGGSICTGAVTFTETASPDAASFTALANWMHGNPGSGRELIKLGAIYHSSPVFVDSIPLDIADAAFNEFRRQPGVAGRPEVVYTGTNDGILHAFRLEADGTNPAGQELWGFIPPMLLDKLEAAKTSPQIMLDGTPVAKNMFMSRALGSDTATYKTVLVSGMREGGNGYFALDVTDPLVPRFLWQFTNPDMGPTYGRPALAQVIGNYAAAGIPGALSADPSQRAVALLPGGLGLAIPGACPTPRDSGGSPFSTFLDSTLAPAPGPVHRTDQRCWTSQGRGLYFVDVETGRLIPTPRLNGPSARFLAPLVGTPAVFNGNEGALANRAFVSDADGILWRVDFSDPNPANWDAAPFHDMAWGLAPDQGQPGYEPPVLSVDSQGRVVVLYAQGNLDNFENPSAINRVVSLTEIDTDPLNAAVETVKAGFNWEFNLRQGELATGPIALFNGIAMFASFSAVTSSGTACDPGASELWAFDYTRAGTTPNTGTPATPSPYLVNAGSDFNDTTYANPSLNEKLVMGLSVTQRPSCTTTTAITGVLPPGFTQDAAPVQAGPPTFQVVANTATGTQQGTGSDIGQIQRTVVLHSRPRVVSWAGASD